MPNFNEFGCGNDKCERRFNCNKFVNAGDKKYSVIANLEDTCSNYDYEYFEEIISKDKHSVEQIYNKLMDCRDLLEQSVEEIENCYGRDIDLTLKIHKLLEELYEMS